MHVVSILAAAAFLAAPATGPQRCEALWQGLSKDPKSQAVFKPVEGKPDAMKKVGAGFQKACERLGEYDVRCGEHSAGAEALEKCPGFREAVESAVYVPELVGEKEAKAFVRRRFQNEAKTNLVEIAKSILAYRANTDRFPPATGATPTADCCKRGGQCETAPEDWGAEGWKTLGFVPKNPVRYHYSIVPEGPFVILLAKGDPACSGETETWQLGFKRGPNGLEMVGPTLLKK